MNHNSSEKNHPSMPPPQPRIINLAKVRRRTLWLWTLIVVIQCLLWSSTDAFIGATIVLIGGGLGLSYCLRRNLLLNNPISTSIILGYVSYYFLLPPIATITEGKALTNNLENPSLVFLNALACLLTLIVAHLLYRKSKTLNASKVTIQKKLYTPLSFFRAPSNIQLMLMGVLGLLVMVVQTFTSTGGSDGSSNELGKFAQAFQPLAHIPYCILVRGLMGKDHKLSKKWVWILAAYTILLLLVSLGKNSRGEFFTGITSIFLAYLYGLFSGLIPAKSINPKKVMTLIIAALLLSGPALDLATSMVVVRGLRTNISAYDLATETVRAYQDKEGLAAARLLTAEKITDWDETYIDNIFLSRLSNLKFTDNSLTLASDLNSEQADYMRSIEWQRTISTLPTPLIALLGFSADKAFVTSGSGGDFLYATATGNSSAIGGFRTGSILGSGYALFGWFYPIVLAAIALITFPIVDASVKITRRQSDHYKTKAIRPIFNCFTIAIFFSWFFYLTSAATGAESMSELAGYILRGWVQTLVIYTIAYWSTHMIVKAITRRRNIELGSAQ